MKTVELILNNDETCYLKSDKVENIPFEHLTSELKKNIVTIYPEFFTWFKEKAKGRDCYAIYCYDSKYGYVLVGYLIYKRCFTKHYGMNDKIETIKICSLYVVNKYRNIGVGSLLVNYLLFTNTPKQCYVTIKKDLQKLNEYWSTNFGFKLISTKDKTNENVYGRIQTRV